MSVTRREFLGAGTGLVIGLYIAPRLPRVFAQPAPAAALDPNAFLRIASDESITVMLAHSEMGQGIWTALPMLAAEELGCDWSKVRVEHAPAAPPYAHTGFGMQMTGGSSSTYSEFDRYRKVGAMAREMLVAAAAAEWKVDAAKLKVANGFVIGPGPGKKASFGQLADAAGKLTPPADVKLKDPKAWKLIGKPTKRLDSPEKVSGRAQFGMDVRLPGMLTALVARGPGFGAKVKKLRPEKALAVKGVRKVVQVPSGVAVIADHFWAAKLGRDALEIEWNRGPALDTDQLRKQLRELAAKAGAKAAGKGDADKALAGAAKVIEADYEFPYLAHAPMEPLNCTVHLAGGRCEIWTGTQFQTLDQMTAARIAGIGPDKVAIHTMFLGGGFGRRATPTSDFTSEAVEVAKASGLGVPIKTVWTREDDVRGGYYRAMWQHRVRAGVGKDGQPVGWRQTIVGQSIAEGTFLEKMMVHGGVDVTSVEGAANSPYLTSVPDHLVDLHSPKLAVPILWWRSVGNTHTAYVMETMIDELAAAAGKDPLAYRRGLLAAHPRHLGVMELCAAKAGWGKKLPKGRFRGLAVHASFESFAAQVAEISVDGDRLKVHKVVCAIDCGVHVNPAGIRAQVESCVAYGLTAALYGRISMKGGEVVESNFHDYKLLRLHEMPQVDVHIVQNQEKSGGVGEVAVPPLAPAVANALFAATGVRHRKLPFQIGGAA